MIPFRAAGSSRRPGWTRFLCFMGGVTVVQVFIYHHISLLVTPGEGPTHHDYHWGAFARSAGHKVTATAPVYQSLAIPFTSLADHRIAFIVTYIGPTFPPWFRAFADSCSTSAHIADWLIFHDGTRPPGPGYLLPRNVHLIDLGQDGITKLFSAVAEEPHHRQVLSTVLTDILHQMPWMIIQFKPALGYIYRDYLHAYSHWAFCDIDLLTGDLGRYLDHHELSDYDILTFSYGDQYRGYLRGQMTIHKNLPWSHEVFRECPHLMDGDMMLEVLLRGDLKTASSEGCYSRIVSMRPDLRVKYAVRSFTDASDEVDDYRIGPVPADLDLDQFHEAIVLKDGRIFRCGGKNQSVDSCARVVTAHAGAIKPQEIPRGELAPAHVAPPDHNCMWWVSQVYQTCLANITAHDNLYLQEGRFYKQAVTFVSHESHGEVEGLLLHFQEWKKGYRHWATPVACAGSSGVLVTQYGFIPVPEAAGPSMTSKGLQGTGPGADWYCSRFDVNDPQAPCLDKIFVDDTTVRRSHDDNTHLMKAQDEDHDVTLLLMLLPGSVYLFHTDWVKWPGPIVLVLYGVDLFDDPRLDSLMDSLGGKVAMFKFPARSSDSHSSTVGGTSVPLKAMQNAGMDLVRTRYVLLLSPDTMLSVSPEETYKSIQAGLQQTHGHPGTVILLPEVEAVFATSPSSASSRAVACQLTPSLPRQVMARWRALSAVEGEAMLEVEVDEAWFGRRDGRGLDMVMDVLSPYGRLFARAVEELGGWGCYDSLYAWMLHQLDYKFYLLPQIAVISAAPANISCGCDAHTIPAALDIARAYIQRARRFYHNW